MAEIAKPLYMALEKDGKKKLIWDTLTTTAFETLKQQVADAVGLNLPNFDRKFVLVTHASETGVGAMLANRDKNNDEDCSHQSEGSWGRNCRRVKVSGMLWSNDVGSRITSGRQTTSRHPSSGGTTTTWKRPPRRRCVGKRRISTWTATPRTRRATDLNEPAARRYPRRNRQPTRRLQLEGASQRYAESAAWGSDNSLSDSLSD